MNLEKAKKLVASDNARKSHEAKIKKYGRENISKVMSHIRKGKKLSTFRTE